jgi:hypothetical protein
VLLLCYFSWNVFDSPSAFIFLVATSCEIAQFLLWDDQQLDQH